MSGEPSRHDTRRLTGAFEDDALEAEFQAEHFDLAVKRFTRFSIALSSVVFLSYGLHDAYVVPEIARRAWEIRYGVFAPVAAAVMATTFSSAYARLHAAAMFVFGMAINLVVIWIGAISPPHGFFIYTGYSILFVTLGPFIARMNVVTQIVYTLCSIALFCAFAASVSRPPVPVSASIVATLGAMGGIGALVARQLEAQAREMFLQRRIIRAQLEQLNAERAKSEELLLNILPASVAERLKADGRSIADGFAEVTVLFADIVGFTKLAQRLSPVEVVRRLNELFSMFDDLAEELKIEKIKTIGDAYMAAAGLEGSADRHAHAMAEMSLGMLDRVARFSSRYPEPLSLRIGLNSGPVVAGVIGKKKFIYDIWGDTVNTASRMESHGTAGTIHVTEETQRRLADAYTFEDRGDVEVKGKGLMRTYYLVGRR
jgi:class 3 adenylate cyclase